MDSFDEKVVKLLNDGGVGFMPSDTIYGLSAVALDEQAVRRLHKLKERSVLKPFIVLISDTKMLDLLAPPQNLSGVVGNRITEHQVFGAGLSELNKDAIELAQKYWPGPVTLICSAPNAPSWLDLGTKSLAIRVPKNSELRDLINEVGPIISTSANLEGEKPADSYEQAKNIFGDQLDFYVDVGRINFQPSTLVKVEGGKLVVVRKGQVKVASSK